LIDIRFSSPFSPRLDPIFTTTLFLHTPPAGFGSTVSGSDSTISGAEPVYVLSGRYGLERYEAGSGRKV
jgi:hypothetical protein